MASKSLLLKRAEQSPAQADALAYRDFMPRDGRGLPVDQNKPGAFRFQCSLGSCHDRRIEEEVLHQVPKNKSYIKQSDLKMIPVLTKEQEDEMYKNQKEKSAIDLMYDACMKEMKYLERNVGRWAREETAKNAGVPAKRNAQSVASARGLKSSKQEEVPAAMTGANRQKGIKTSQVFRTQGEEDSIMQLMKEAHDAEKMRNIARNARAVARKEIEAHLNEEEKSAVAVRMGHVDHHMYLDENSSKEAPDPEDHPDRIVYAPVKPIRHDDSSRGAKGKDD